MIKIHRISETNINYIERFKSSVKESSWLQYKVSCGGLLELLNEKDLSRISVSDIENYINSKTCGEAQKKNTKAHIRSMLSYAVKNNIGDIANKIDKSVLIYLL